MTMAGPAYCAVADVITALTSYNSTGTSSDISSDVITLAINQASARVSAWTGRDWGTDASGASVAVPDMIQSITVDIAVYYSSLSYWKNKSPDANNPVLLRYNAAMSDLKAIQEGQITPNPVPLDTQINGAGHVVNTIPGIFTGRDSNTTMDRGHVEAQSYPAPGTLPWLS